MLQSEQIEELITLVSGLDRETLIGHIRSYRAAFPVDFTSDYLQQLPTERIRHIFVALCLQSQRMPDNVSNAA